MDQVLLTTILFMILIFLIIAWELILKLIGMWDAARRGQSGWFILMGIVNSFGIIPLIYLGFFRKPIKRNKENC